MSNVLSKFHFTTLCCTAIGLLASSAHAVSSSELYTEASYPYGKFEARVQFAGGDGIVGSFFLWKDLSEMSDVYWNELDLETVWADCELFSNALYGLPEASHTQSHGADGSWCTGFHTYAYEWTPDYIAWFVDGVEVRRETAEDSTAFRDNAENMQIHFNVWPGDSTFGGNFSPDILPLFEYINWVQYSSYADGEFTLEWREDFGRTALPEGWLTGEWDSPKGQSTHSPDNVAFFDGYAVLSLTADDATGSAGAAPMDPEGGGPILEPDPDPVDPPDETDPMTGNDAGTPVDGNPVDGSPVDGSGGAPPAPSDTAGAGGDAKFPPSNSTGGAAAPGTGTGGSAPSQPVVGGGGQQAVPMGPAASGGTPATPTGAPGSGGTPAAPAGAPGAPPVAAQSPAVMETTSGSDGGCSTARGAGSNPWGVALLLGLCASWISRRRTRA